MQKVPLKSENCFVRQRFANDFQWEIPIETHTCAELSKNAIYAIHMRENDDRFIRFQW